MAHDTEPDLDKIHLQEAYFLESLIQNAEVGAVVLPERIASFSRPQTRMLPMFSLERNSVSFDIMVAVTALDADDQPLPVKGRFRLLMSYVVENLADLLQTNEQTNQQIPNIPLTISLIGAAYSTARGMIISKVSDTVLHGLSLPLRSSRQLMQESQLSAEELEKLLTAKVRAKETKQKPKKDSKPSKSKE